MTNRPPQPAPRRMSLGMGTDGRDVTMDVDLLLRTRLLIQANSGGGKSWLLRRCAEQLFGAVPVFIIDPEGEFASLRERLDFVLVGKGGETPADVRSARSLGHRLLELNASAVCDLYELDTVVRHEWVAAFLSGLIDAPKHLWRPLVVMVDEAHVFAPERGAGESVATDAMLSLATRGRKRGYCSIYATQRLGKLRKDAAAELQNVLIGQTFIDLDRERAAEALGVPRSKRRPFFDQIKTMPPGRFFGFGRAIATEPMLVNVGDVLTTHPEPGTFAHHAEPPPAPARIRHLLPQLADLPRDAKAESSTDGQIQTHALREELAFVKRELERIRREAATPRIERVAHVPSELRHRIEKGAQELAKIVRELEQLDGQPLPSDAMPVPAREPARTKPPVRESSPGAAVKPLDREASRGGLPRGARNILEVLAARRPHPLTRTQISRLTGIAPNGGTLRTYLGRLATDQLVEREGDLYSLTDIGGRVAGSVSVATTPHALVALWRSKLPGKARDMLDLFAAEHGPLTARTIADRIGIDVAGGTFRTYLGHLRANGLIKKAAGGFVVATELEL